MQKRGQLSMSDSILPGNMPTLGMLEQQIRVDNTLSQTQKDSALQMIALQTANAPPSTPLRDLLPRLGGTLLGWLISKYFGMGLVGQAVASVAGYGIGKVLGDAYTSFTDPRRDIRRLF